MEAMRRTGLESKPWVVGRRALEKHERDTSVGEQVKPLLDQPAADTLSLHGRQHTDRTEHLHVDEPARSVEPAAGEHHVSDDLADVVSRRDQRKPAVAIDARSEVIDEPGHDFAM